LFSGFAEAIDTGLITPGHKDQAGASVVGVSSGGGMT